MFTQVNGVPFLIVDYPSLLVPNRPQLDPIEQAKFDKASKEISALIKSLGIRVEIPDHHALINKEK